MGDSRFGEPQFCEGQRGLAAQRRQPIGDFPLLTVLVYVADEHPAFEAGTRTL